MLFSLTSLNNKKSAIFILILLALAFYDVLWDLLSALPHYILILLHYLFETCEQLLDWLIEHLFHTSPRTTEIIVFYIMAGSVAGISFMVLRSLPDFSRNVLDRLTKYFQHKKTKVLTAWHQRAAQIQIKWYSLLMTSTIVIAVLTLS